MRGVTYTQHGPEVDEGNFQLAIRGWGSGNPHPYFSLQVAFRTHNLAALKDGGDATLPGISYPLERTLADGTAVDIEQMIIDCPEGLDVDADGYVYVLGPDGSARQERSPYLTISLGCMKLLHQSVWI